VDRGSRGGRGGGKEARDLFTLQRLEGGKGRGGRGINNQVKRKSQTRRRAALTRGGGKQDRERVMEVEVKGGREDHEAWKPPFGNPFGRGTPPNPRVAGHGCRNEAGSAVSRLI